MRAGAFEANVVFFQRVNEHPIGFDMAIPASGKFSAQWMVLVFGRQEVSCNQEIEEASERVEVFAPTIHPFHIPLEL